MKRYRLGYDYLFLSKDAFVYKDDLIGGTSINVLFKVFDDKGNEVLFESNELADQKLYFENGNSCYLNELFDCFFDKEIVKKFEPNILLLKESGYSISFEIESYTKDIEKGCMLEPTFIDKDEFMDIMKNNTELFDNSDNKPTQTTTYFTEEVKEFKVLGKKYPKVDPEEKYTLEIVTKIEPVFKYSSCEPVMIDDNISTIEKVREIASTKKNLLQGQQFFLVTKYENKRMAFSGKLYNI